MRINKIKTNVTVLNKVDRKNYQIINVDGSGDSIKGTAKLIKEDGSLDDSVTAVITANNAIAYKLIDDPNIPDVPTGYTVENGILLKDGVPATEQGSLVINSIIAGVAGRLILSVEPREPREGYFDIMSYTVESDKFNKLIRRSIPEVTIIASSENKMQLYMTYSRTYTKDKKLEDGTIETDNIFDAAAIMLYDVMSDAVVDHVSFAEPIKAVDSVKAPNETIFAIEADTVVDSDGVIKEDDYITLRFVASEGHSLSLYKTTAIDSVPESISKGYNASLIKASSGKWYINDITYKIPDKIVAELAGYNVIVDITSKDHVTRISLANTNTMEIKTLVISETRDRGDIITIE
jgi:hypothetical protein